MTRRPVLGWTISLLLHATGIAWLWHTAPPHRVSADTEPARQMTVWLLPSPAPVPAAAPSSPAPIRAALAPGRTPRRSRAGATPVAAAVLDAPPVVSSETDAAPSVEEKTPAFDLAAARASARAMVRADRAGLAAQPLRQDAIKATTSERMQERFERARRVDCLKGKESVNLLANVLSLAKDMVANAVDDSGCKW